MFVWLYFSYWLIREGALTFRFEIEKRVEYFLEIFRQYFWNQFCMKTKQIFRLYSLNNSFGNCKIILQLPHYARTSFSTSTISKIVVSIFESLIIFLEIKKWQEYDYRDCKQLSGIVTGMDACQVLLVTLTYHGGRCTISLKTRSLKTIRILSGLGIYITCEKSKFFIL